MKRCHSLLLVSIVVLLLSVGCVGERYRKDKNNRMTRKAKIANDYLAQQAVKLTKFNLSRKEKNEQIALKRKRRAQNRLNDLNSKSNVRQKGKHSGDFIIY